MFTAFGLLSSRPSGIDQTIAGILGAADPMQELIDAMGFGTKPTYMWGGDESSGATEIGGSGYDMTDTSMLKSQTATVSELGSGNFSVTNASTDYMGNATDSALQPGTSSFAWLWVGGIQSLPGSRNICGDHDFTRGFYFSCTSGGQLNAGVRDGGGVYTAFVSSALTAGQGLVAMATVNQTSNDIDLHTPAGSSNVSGSLAGTTVSAATQKFTVVGDLQAGVGHEALEFGIFAYWLGSAAESLTSTHMSNLNTWLGY